MKRLLLVVCTLAAMVPAMALADWADDFDSYAVDSSLHGQGGWAGWENDSAFTAYISDLYALSPTNSVEIAAASDIVHRYNGYTTGEWTYTAWMYIPTGFTGQSYFILLNTYGATNNWSVQVYFQDGLVVNTGSSGGSLPWILDQWVELRLVIDLTNDMQTFYYGGTPLYIGSWTGEVSGAGALNIGAVDLFANGASPVYYDDMSLVSGAVATESTTMGNVKALFR